MERYPLDSNIFITSENHIPEDMFPSFWARLGELLASGTAVLRQTVLDELRRHRDPLVEWVGGQGGVEVMPTSEGALERHLDVCARAESQGHASRAVREFESEARADTWLCAEALASGLTVVTYETSSNSPNRVKIPDACAGVGARCMGGFDLMRGQGFRF